jgi:hypothetical protein
MKTLIDKFYADHNVFDEYIGDAIAELAGSSANANRLQALLQVVLDSLGGKDEAYNTVMLGRFVFANINDHIQRLSDSPEYEVLK